MCVWALVLSCVYARRRSWTTRACTLGLVLFQTIRGRGTAMCVKTLKDYKKPLVRQKALMEKRFQTDDLFLCLCNEQVKSGQAKTEQDRGRRDKKAFSFFFPYCLHVLDTPYINLKQNLLSCSKQIRYVRESPRVPVYARQEIPHGKKRSKKPRLNSFFVSPPLRRITYIHTYSRPVAPEDIITKEQTKASTKYMWRSKCVQEKRVHKNRSGKQRMAYVYHRLSANIEPPCKNRGLVEVRMSSCKERLEPLVLYSRPWPCLGWRRVGRK